MTHDAFAERVAQLTHAIQSAVAFQIERGSNAALPKHLRTGLDTTKAEHGGIARLLIRKGVITEEEYFDAVVEGLEVELRFQTEQAQRMGAPANVRFL